MQRKLCTEFDYIGASAFGWGYTVPIFSSFGGFMCSALVHVGYIFYPFSCNFTDVLIKHILDLADQMHICIQTSECVQLSTCSEGKICEMVYLNYSLLINF